VVLVLLIIFMVITPMLQRGISVQVPEETHAVMVQGAEPAFMTATVTGVVFVEQDDTPTTQEHVVTAVGGADELDKREKNRAATARLDAGGPQGGRGRDLAPEHPDAHRFDRPGTAQGLLPRREEQGSHAGPAGDLLRRGRQGEVRPGGEGAGRDSRFVERLDHRNDDGEHQAGGPPACGAGNARSAGYAGYTWRGAAEIGRAHV